MGKVWDVKRNVEMQKGKDKDFFSPLKTEV